MRGKFRTTVPHDGSTRSFLTRVRLLTVVLHAGLVLTEVRFLTGVGLFTEVRAHGYASCTGFRDGGPNLSRTGDLAARRRIARQDHRITCDSAGGQGWRTLRSIEALGRLSGDQHLRRVRPIRAPRLRALSEYRQRIARRDRQPPPRLGNAPEESRSDLRRSRSSNGTMSNRSDSVEKLLAQLEKPVSARLEEYESQSHRQGRFEI